MDVCHDNNMWGKGTPETRLTPLPVNRSFLWDKQEILIPAVYVGKAGAAQGQPGRSDGPRAVFMTGKNAAPENRSAVSSLHFEPVPNVQWRVIFQIKPKNDAKTSFPIKN